MAAGPAQAQVTRSVAAPAGVTSTVVATPGLKQFPLQPRSLAAQLRPRNRAILPQVQQWATTVIGDGLDQPTGLMEVQVVSAMHIYRVFTRELGSTNAAIALRIAWRESRLLPNVVNDTNKNRTMDWGLFQLNDGGTLQAAGGLPQESVLRPRWNSLAAARLVAAYGWDPWGGSVYQLPASS